MRKFVSILIAACFLFVLGCNKKAPTDSNFEAALNQSFQPVCFWIGGIGGQIPGNFPGVDPRLDRLVYVGLLSKTPGPPYHAGGEVSPSYNYDYTSTGRQFEAGPPSHPNFCYATAKVTKIISFTEPGSDNTSTVSYSWKRTNIAQWANDPIIQKLYIPNNNFDAEFQSSSQMILTNKGWAVQ